MGSPMSKFRAEAVMQAHQNVAFTMIQSRLSVKYADDVFVFIKGSDI